MKITEKGLKQIITEANLGPLKTTTFGLRCERGGKGYEVALVPRDGTTPAETLLKEGSASEAAACIEGVIATQRMFSTSMLGSTAKPEFATQEHFLKQNAERCPRTKCNSKDIQAGWLEKGKGTLEQVYRCDRCGLEWVVSYKLEGYGLALGALES